MSDAVVRTSCAAWASLILGLLCLVFGPLALLADLPGLALAAFTLVVLTLILRIIVGIRIRRNAGWLRGEGLANGGMAAAIIGGLLSFLTLETCERGGTSTRIVSVNKLKQIALALHRYAEDHEGRFPPPANYGKDGQALLSWRVLLLPYLDDSESIGLYERFHLAEPWDSPHSRTLLKDTPSFYRQPYSPSECDKQETIYQVLVGPGTIFGGKTIPSISEITKADGLSETLLVVEAGEPVPWTKPSDLEIEQDQPLPPLGGLIRKSCWWPFGRHLTNPHMFNVAFADNHVRWLPKRESFHPTIRAAATWNGGEKVELP